MVVRLMPLVGLAVSLSLVAGCGAGKLNESRHYELEPGLAQGFVCPEQSSPQKINIDFNSTDADVTVLLFNKTDVKDDDSMPHVDAGKALGKATGKSGSFSVNVPEKTGTYVVVRDAKKSTKVDVKVNNQK
jgi:hypothetical protein